MKENVKWGLKDLVPEHSLLNFKSTPQIHVIFFFTFIFSPFLLPWKGGKAL